MSHKYADLALVQRWLAQLAYKPGATMTARLADPIGLIKVDFEIQALDSTKPEQGVLVRDLPTSYALPMERYARRYVARQAPEPVETVVIGPHVLTGPFIPIRQTQIVPLYLPGQGEDRDYRLFTQWVRSAWLDFEAHEADEWLREKGGKPLFDPHA